MRLSLPYESRMLRAMLPRSGCLASGEARHADTPSIERRELLAADDARYLNKTVCPELFHGDA
ncbi:MAG: hypothetical protein U0136_00735 [Bdellovibrionota bacterium]